MAQIELNEGLARSQIQPGELRNRHGVSASRAVRARFRQFRDLLDEQAHAPCTDHPHDPPVSNAKCLVDSMFRLAKNGERWAAVLVLNRWLGRIPLEIELNSKIDRRGTLTEEQKARYRELIDRERQHILTPGEVMELRAFRGVSGHPQLTPAPSSSNVIDVESTHE
jgi:hypothetical protein